MTFIYELGCNSGEPQVVAVYSIPSKQALIAFIHQTRRNGNFWDYPDDMEGIWESRIIAGHQYYRDLQNNRVFAAYPAPPRGTVQKKEVTA